MKNKKTLILDLDGTLYYQYGVQCIMGCRMLLYYLIHFWKWKEFMVIMEYRKNRENNIEEIIDKQYILVAEKYSMSVKEVEKIIKQWLFQKPLRIVKFFRDRKLCAMIEEYKKRGLNIIIYSDYPTKEKLDVLNFKYDKAYDSTHKKIRVLKPDIIGLKYIIESNNLKEEEILFIGDRDTKDGECARRCNIDYIILPKVFRSKKYLEIKQKVGVQ